MVRPIEPIPPGAVPAGTSSSGPSGDDGPTQRLYLVKIEYLGRSVKDMDVVFNAFGAQDLATQIHRFARGRLASRDPVVDVYLDPDTGDGKFSVNWGRFGKGTIEDRGEFRP